MTPIKLVLGLLLIFSLATPALAGYTSGGTFVVKADGLTVVDNGGVLCQGLSGSGVGGGCLAFPPPNAFGEPNGFVGVIDDSAGMNVAFQVCLDNNGDGVCGGPASASGPCRDQIFFSHTDSGKFFNPLGPLPTQTLRECPGAFQGYVVLLCEGAHEPVGGTPHTHQLTQGTIFHANFGSGYGDFCGGNGGGTPAGFVNTAAKAYRVV